MSGVWAKQDGENVSAPSNHQTIVENSKGRHRLFLFWIQELRACAVSQHLFPQRTTRSTRFSLIHTNFVGVWCVCGGEGGEGFVVVVEWFYSKRMIIDKKADLSDFFRRFSSVKCVFCFTSNESCHFSSEKTVRPQNGLLIFLW